MEQFRSTTIQNDEHANTRTSSSLMRELIWVAAICLFFKTSTAIAQSGDYATQPETVSGNGTTTMVSSDNYGHFVATNTTIDFVGNDGALISQIAGLSSSSNICVATDAYYENFLIATSSGTNISVYECSGYDFGNKCIRMADPNVVTGLVPPLITTQPIVSGSGTSVTRIVATIDYFGDMVIAWQTNTRRLGFMNCLLYTS